MTYPRNPSDHLGICEDRLAHARGRTAKFRHRHDSRLAAHALLQRLL